MKEIETTGTVSTISTISTVNKFSIYHEDCFTILENMVKEGKKFNAIITDPPYAISRKTNFSSGKKPPVTASQEIKNAFRTFNKHHNRFGAWDNTEIDFDRFIALSYELLEKGGTLFMFYDIWKIQNIKETAEKYKFKQPRMGIWIKTNPVPVNSKLNYLTNAKEIFVTFVKGGKPTFNSKYDNAVYSFPICQGNERTKHTTQKPLKLMEEIVLKHTNEHDTILDPFMGSGTTGEASLKYNRRFTGIELDKEYFDIASNRLNLAVSATSKVSDFDIDEW